MLRLNNEDMVYPYALVLLVCSFAELMIYKPLEECRRWGKHKTNPAYFFGQATLPPRHLQQK